MHIIITTTAGKKTLKTMQYPLYIKYNNFIAPSTKFPSRETIQLKEDYYKNRSFAIC